MRQSLPIFTVRIFNLGDVAFIVQVTKSNDVDPLVFLYSPEGRCNYQLASLPTRSKGGAIFILNESIIFCGGLTPMATKKCWKYGINENAWTEFSSSQYDHFKHPGVVYKNKLYYFMSGGKSEIFDPVKNTWTPWRMPAYEHGTWPCMLAWKDSIIYIGGELRPQGVQKYNITTGTWTVLSAVPNALGRQWGCSSTQIPGSTDKYLIVTGPMPDERYSAIYDASTDTWKKTADTNLNRRFSVLVTLGKRIFALAGQTELFDTVEEYFVEKDAWEMVNLRLQQGATVGLSVPASWFDNKNLKTPLANGCKGVL